MSSRCRGNNWRCVIGKTEEEHIQNLTRLMLRAKDRGLVFNSSKCIIKKQSIPFSGNLYTDKGIVPDPLKLQDNHMMPTPESKEDLQRFLGLVTYLSSYIPNFSSESQPLRNLLKNESLFIWDINHQTCFEHLKSLVNDESCLSYYDTDKPLVLEVDASMKGLGAAVIQDTPIAFASKTLTSTQAAYSNIEREALALVHGVERFHTYLYGRTFSVFTDHKPLVMLHQKPINRAPPRLQHMFLKLTEYDFDLIYIPGKTHSHDCLIVRTVYHSQRNNQRGHSKHRDWSDQLWNNQTLPVENRNNQWSYSQHVERNYHDRMVKRHQGNTCNSQIILVLSK